MVEFGKPERSTIVTEPTAEPVSADQVRLALGEVSRIEADNVAAISFDEHVIKNVCIPAARRLVERYGAGDGSMAVLTQTRDDFFHAAEMKGVLRLARKNAATITEIVVTDDDGDTETVSSAAYYLLPSTTSEVVLRDGYVWPEDPRPREAMRVRYTAGYGASSIGTPNYNGTGANGTGNNALVTGGTYCRSDDVTYRVQIVTATTFKYSEDGGVIWKELDYAGTTGKTIDGTYQLLNSGLHIKFPATSGYTPGDYWDIACTGHDVPQHVFEAIRTLAAMIYSAGNQDSVMGEGGMPEAIRLLLGPTVRI